MSRSRVPPPGTVGSSRAAAAGPPAVGSVRLAPDRPGWPDRSRARHAAGRGDEGWSGYGAGRTAGPESGGWKRKRLMWGNWCGPGFPTHVGADLHGQDARATRRDTTSSPHQPRKSVIYGRPASAWGKATAPPARRVSLLRFPLLASTSTLGASSSREDRDSIPSCRFRGAQAGAAFPWSESTPGTEHLHASRHTSRQNGPAVVSSILKDICII